ALAWVLPTTQEFVVLTQPSRPNPVILFSGRKLLWSPEYVAHAICNWRILFKQAIWVPLPLARERAGSSKEARMAIMAITTSNSIRVNARRSGTFFEEVKVVAI